MTRPSLTPRVTRGLAAAAVAAAGLLAAGPAGVARDHTPGITPGSNPDAYAYTHQQGYVHLNAPLYPSPRQNVPVQMGGTMVTNPAFAPHEYLYPHDYRALYGPFYHRSRGTWVITPWGVRTNERWDLVGTEVKVKYRSHIPFFTGFSAPFNRRETLFDNEWGNTPNYGSRATGDLNYHP